MPTIIPHTPLYSFLWFIERHDLNLEKKILDCGAGGRLPPLTMFNEFGFKTHGIDISKNQIKHANDYSNTKGMTLNIVEG
ncbi:MAG: class I SAM-dependent methyltransferase, partial [Candidatus Heimdallarchaeota archaeon]